MCSFSTILSNAMNDALSAASHIPTPNTSDPNSCDDVTNKIY